MFVEYRTDVYPQSEAEDGVQRNNPAHGAVVVVDEVARREVSVECGHDVHQAEGGKEGEPAAEDDEPGAEAAFGVGVFFRVGAGGGW